MIRSLVALVGIIAVGTAWQCVSDATGGSESAAGIRVSVVIDRHYDANSKNRVDVKLLCGGVMVDLVRYGEVDTLLLPAGETLIARYRVSGEDVFSQKTTIVAEGLTWNPPYDPQR